MLPTSTSCRDWEKRAVSSSAGIVEEPNSEVSMAAPSKNREAMALNKASSVPRTHSCYASAGASCDCAANSRMPSAREGIQLGDKRIRSARTAEVQTASIAAQNKLQQQRAAT